MRIFKIIIIVSFILSLLSSCSLTPTVADVTTQSEKITESDIPEVGTKYKPKLKKDKARESSDMAEDFILEKVEISKKKNGILIKFNYSGEDPKENISTFFSGDNFFNITFFKGRFGNNIKKSIFNSSVINNLKFFEFEESVQVTLRLKNDHSSTYIQTNDGQILISVFN